jgi:hypothetical protein
VLLVTALPPAADALDALRARRAARRTDTIEPFDAFYQAYVTVLLAGVAIVTVSSWVGDDAVGAAGRSHLVDTGPALLGLLCAVALMIGMRSGSRGGPVAIEPAEVRHVLLGPVDIGRALRAPAVRQLRFLGFASLVIGAVAGQFAARRLPGGTVAWVAAAAAFALATCGLAIAVAWLAGGSRCPPSVATAMGVALVGWSVWDLALDAPTAPGTVVGRLAFLPLRADPSALAAVPVGAALALVGIGGLGGVSLERLRRRSTLIGHLRFAATMRDVRTVMVLRRQLAQERPPWRPWLRPRRHGGRTVVVLRDWRSLMRGDRPDRRCRRR